MEATTLVQPWTTEPLTEAERQDFQRRFAARLTKVKAKTADVFAFRDVKAPPFIVNGALYWVFGLDPETFPDDYFDPACMTAYQERTYYDQVVSIDDDFVPYLVPWYGTVVDGLRALAARLSSTRSRTLPPIHATIRFRLRRTSRRCRWRIQSATVSCPACSSVSAT